MLLTTVEVKHKTEAFERLERYAKRWGIKVYHRLLKSGCRVEARQLENVRRLRNCLAIDLVVAWRIHHLTTLGRETPDVPCTVYFTQSEWRALTTFVNHTKTPPDLPPSLNEAVCLLGQLGGHLERTGDGPPGTEVLWRGMARLADIRLTTSLKSLQVACSKMSPTLVLDQLVVRPARSERGKGEGPPVVSQAAPPQSA